MLRRAMVGFEFEVYVALEKGGGLVLGDGVADGVGLEGGEYWSVEV